MIDLGPLDGKDLLEFDDDPLAKQLQQEEKNNWTLDKKYDKSKFQTVKPLPPGYVTGDDISVYGYKSKDKDAP